MTEPGTGTLSADLQVLVDAWTGVAVDLYGQLVAAGGRLDHSNLVVSPSSAAAAGALDRALLELARADELDLRISNAVWTQDGLALRLEFERALVEAFRAGLHRADFRHDPEGTRRAINQLVSQQTAGKIPELFDPGAIRSDISLVLTNAIYLEARWLQAFDPDETRPEPFNLLSRGTTEVVMLHRRGSLGYAAGDGWRAVELPYRGGRLVMDVILPDEGRFDRFRDGLEVERLRELLGALDSREVRLALPRFDFDSDLDLRAPLQALGMRIAFTDAADFSGITDEAALRVDRVVQRAHVEIDERGTTAAAATGATMQLVSVVTPSRPIELRVDWPFLFAVRDRMTGALLFIGQVTNPAA